MVTIPLISVIILIVILHTIISHLLNWGWRNVEEPNSAFWMGVGTLIESVILIVLLNYYIK